MLRILLFVFTLLPIIASANPTLQLDKRLGLTATTTTAPEPMDKQAAELAASTRALAQQASDYQQALLGFDARQQALREEMLAALKDLPLSKRKALASQSEAAYVQLSNLKEREAALTQEVNALLARHNALPGAIESARQNLQQHQKAPLAPADTPRGQLQLLQRNFYEQSLLTLENEQASSQKRIELKQLELQLTRQLLVQQEQLIERLNRAGNEQRQQQTAATLADSRIESADKGDPVSEQLRHDNALYGQKLQTLTLQINNVLELQEKAEKRYQHQAQQLGSIQEQLTWVKTNAAFGDRFLQMLQSLPKVPNVDQLQNQIADLRLARYQLEQQLTINEEQLGSSGLFSKDQQALLQSQQTLLGQLLESHDQLLGELGKLKVSYDQLTQQHHQLKSTLSEHLFWVPNAAAIGKLWLIDVHRSLVWLVQQAQWDQLSLALDEQLDYWYWWILVLVLSLILQDLITPLYHRAMDSCLVSVGNVTQDNFIFTFKALIYTLGFSLLRPTVIILAGSIWLLSERNMVQAVGMGLLAMGCLYWLQRLVVLLCQDKGLLVGHFKRPKVLVEQILKRCNLTLVIALPLVGIIGMSEVLEVSLVRNSLGRGAFILVCLLLLWLYKDVLALLRRHQEPTPGGKNSKLLQRLLWTLLLVTPPLAAVLAIRGYYFSAFQMLLQLQLSLLLGLGFLLLFQLIKRWMLIERRRIAFDRAKAKRAEKLAQRERGEAVSSDGMDTYEEPKVDLETISSQSLGLVRSLLLLAFLASLIGLWSQTHSALFSFLDGITLWTSSTNINGLEQPLPITLKSVLFGSIIVGFSLMIATNLPGLLELVLLQRLDLTPGTGFAITTVSRYLVVLIGGLVGFSTFGMEWSKLQWLVAALSVGLGFGLQEIFANFISGLIILFEKPVRIGDTVTIRDLTGTVSKIQIRATTIIDWDRKEIIVPNKAFITEQLVNWSLSDPITRVTVYVSVARDSDPARVEATLYQAIKECQYALQTPEAEVWFAGFGKHTQDYEVRAYAKDMGNRWPLRHDLHKRISAKLRENQLELAYPQMEITINQLGGQQGLQLSR
ncbi:mechanosensitive ion channel [Shewanella cyperi]|uniref:Mechanosensitive ion channel n=1 Tax=Shewanella cyperi TaxID=2814292 RepID=A0A974XJE6_9GAMM|nr:mechanosensitive ion channel domain-containing protein [Shewanella cyperi]QSX29485.1 mechanosensitive ion channel [Shewanella cyperi]